MQYLALLMSKERQYTPDEQAAMMTAFENFHAKSASAIRAGDALTPQATGVRISGGPDAPVVTDGPFAEGAEVACGYYVFEAENLDEALALARDVPVAAHGAIEVRPTYHTFDPDWSLSGAGWLALLLEPPGSVNTPGTPEWEAEAARHGEFAASAGDHIVGGAALHEPATATTVRVRDGEVLLTDGPFPESAEIATGFYLLSAADRDEAVKLASMIPASTVELRQLAGVSHL
ncbi:YciI family protein [Mycobacterium branderi]|uniref:Transcription initiation protein n=1 Tax=Mycobacterium branderi TaxID=43348 RepID=A0A7I7W0N0_9MYCO|nr:YciI family protein [Mycobacterium branderi]MCV7233383.1 transcription initiation protein [Mycobacterium branderi]ORA41440.1 transcription initiation protein [Mycobacterium branderi]BBZ10497.1 transcription initiation protein [Mycobacterium branderi]